MDIACTVCSREKSDAPGEIPAIERYKGEHIAVVSRIARQRKLPLYFLSGLIGLIPHDYTVCYYDHRLELDHVDELARRVSQQIRTYGITVIRFYYKRNREGWVPYLRTLERATAIAGIELRITTLPEPKPPLPRRSKG